MARDETPMAAGLLSLLSSVDPRKATVVSCTPISGGYSRVTGIAEVRWDDGEETKLVLRADPPGGVGVFNSERDPEWELLQALTAVDTLVIPRPYWYDGTGEHFGTKCIVMEHCEGTPLQLTLAGLDDVGPALDVYLEVAAAIHRTPLDALPPEMERPTDWDAYLDSAIDLYDQTERAVADSSPIVRYVTAWLRTHKPPPVPLGLVHGDLQPGNILVADGREPVVIDWEFTRVGDPREDLGYYSQNPLPNNLYSADPERFLARYRELSGYTAEQLNAEVLQFFFVLGMAKLFAQMMEGADAVAQGRARGLMNLFLVNSLSYFHNEYLQICKGSMAGASR